MSDRRMIVDALLANPPVVHLMDTAGTLGVWSTEPECYCFLADRCGPGVRTLETGAGLSTLLFAALDAVHDCVTPSASEVARLKQGCHERQLSYDGVRFHIGRSEDVLPRLEHDELDLVFIDGNHGFPVPMCDFFFAAARLRRGGVVVLDDLQLPVVALVADFCDLDPRWHRLVRTNKWGAWERLSQGAFEDDHFNQPFLTEEWRPGHDPPVRVQVRRLVAHIVRGGRRRIQRLSGKS